MNQATTDAIRQLLRERVALTQSNQEASSNYVSVMECILQVELNQEIEAIKFMLLDLDAFEDQFKARCAKRETDKDCAIPLSVMPDSISNQLYWEIAQLAFEPQTTKEMLNIIAPSIKENLKVDLELDLETPRITSAGGTLQPWTTKPTLVLSQGFDTFEQEELRIEALTHYILSEKTILNTKEIALFSLMLQAKLQSQLTDEYPALAKQLYEHNASLSALFQDIRSLNNKGATPKTAIEQLILGLTVGGEKMTGQEYAGKSSIEAVGRFSEYFNALPDGTKAQLRALEGGSIQLGRIIDNELAAGQCVETTSTHLTRILQENSNKPVLTSPPELSPLAVTQLKNKYGPKQSLDTKKDPLLAPTFPVQLTQKVIGRIAPTTDEELMNLILDFPPLFYDTLWQHITLNNAPKALENLTQMLKSGFFNPEQKEALAQALTKHYQRFQAGESVLSWAITTNDPICLKEALGSYAEKDRLTAVKVKDNDGNTLLHLAAYNAESLKIILNLLPEADRLAAVKVKDNNGQTSLHHAACNPKSLKIILDLYPEKDRLDAVQVQDKFGKTLLDLAAHNPESLKAILTLLPEKDRLTAVQVKDKYGQTLLHHAAYNFESLKAIHSSLSKEQSLFLNIKEAMRKVCSDYHSRTDNSYQGAHQFRFFSPSGGEEATKATDFNMTKEETQSIKEAIALIDDFLINSDTRYHTHSLASYVFNNLSALMPINNSQPIMPDEQGHYSVDAWHQVKQSLESLVSTEGADDSLDLSVSNGPL